MMVLLLYQAVVCLCALDHRLNPLLGVADNNIVGIRRRAACLVRVILSLLAYGERMYKSYLRAKHV